MSPDLALDAVLAVALPLLAWRVLASRDLRTSIVLFIALGLLSALAWARLAAPDIALVEAAVGTGITGALLMSCLPWAGALSPSRPGPPARARRRGWIAIIPVAALVVVLAWATLALPAHGAGLSREVLSELGRSGVSHPVTAVLLNYRGYDTLLEIVVLLVAAVGIDAVLPTEPRARLRSPGGRSLVDTMATLIIPGFVLVAGYLVWKGSHAPGGAFQAGAVVAAGGVLLLLAYRLGPPSLRSRKVRVLVLMGPVVFLALALAPLAWGSRMLEYPPQSAGALILGLESVLVTTIAIVLVMFFPARSVAPTRPRTPHEDAP